MRAIIASDDQNVASRIRRILLAEGVDCPMHLVVSIDSCIEVVSTDEAKPNVILFVMPNDPDRPVAVLQNLRRASNASVVAVGSARDPQQILRLVRLGADDYLDVEGELERDLGEFLKRFCAIDDRPTDIGKIVTVMSPSGGSGCSFLAANLAIALAKTHGKVALCDMDLRRGDLASYLNIKPRHTINDLCRSLNRLDQGMFAQSLHAHDSGVQLLAAPDALADIQPISAEAAERIMKMSRSQFPFTIVDLEDFFHREQLQVLQMSDVALMVLRLDFTSLRNARRTLEYMKNIGVDQSKIQIVVNKYGRSKELPVSEAEEALGVKFQYFVPDDPKTAVLSLNRGTPAMIYAPKTKLSYAIGDIATALAQKSPVTV
jgi:pilus assembly protein CpaE